MRKSIPSDVRVITKEDAMKGRGWVARTEHLKKIANTPQSACFRSVQRPDPPISPSELTSPPSLHYVKKNTPSQTLKKSLLNFDVLGKLEREQEKLIHSRFGELKKQTDLYYQKAEVFETVTGKLQKLLDYQKLQQENYQKKHEGEFKQFGSGNFEAPYKGQRLNKEKNALFAGQTQNMDIKELEATRMGVDFCKSELMMTHSNVMDKFRRSTSSFDKQIDRSQSLKSSKVGQDHKWEVFGFDYQIGSHVGHKTGEIGVVMKNQVGRDGKINGEQTEMKKWVTSKQLEKKFGNKQYKISISSK
ncbi:Hypothetical_protein [Hexamita inflata]|uniref:Hypothetical_protein n=1 Tax=Hexamita inflata TaxID=28002 RepID=A0AA86UN12_9EUKA|nr:Hypothetical protein HINF_LOCUS49319 [Hexamita inflata]